jgi:asparagine synthase (glutamine-hydrolysing)
MRTAHPVGSALSGGLDSSSIVCIARDFFRQRGVTPLPTFSGVFDEFRASDERPYIAAVVAQGDIAPHYVVADRISPLANFDKVLRHLEEPVWTPNLYMHWGLYGQAKTQGIRVFLDGFLGDNVVGHGWEYLMDLAYSWRWPQLYRELRAVSKRRPGFALSGLAWRYFAGCSVGARFGGMFSQRSQSTMQNATIGESLHSLVVHPELAKRINLSARLRARQAAQPKPPQAARKRLYSDLSAGEIQLGLEIANKSASAFQLEDRYPFTDRRLVEFSMATPPDQRIEDGLSRMVLRRALSGVLPEKVRLRTGKGDLSFALQRSLLKFEEPLLDDLLLSDPNGIEEYVDLPVVRRSYLEYKQRHASDNFYGLWAAINLALWKQQRLPDLVAS